MDCSVKKWSESNLKISHDNLVRELKNKNPDALEFTIDTYGKLLYTIAYNVLNSYVDKTVIHECVSEALTSVWFNIDSFNNEKGSFKTWLIAITKYKAIDYRRRHNSKPQFVNVDENDEISLENTDESILSEERRAEVIGAIKKLGEPDSEIFMRKYFLEQSVECIAKSFGLTRQAVDNRLWRGRKKLKEMLFSLREERII